MMEQTRQRLYDAFLPECEYLCRDFHSPGIGKRLAGHFANVGTAAIEAGLGKPYDDVISEKNSASPELRAKLKAVAKGREV